MADVTWLTHPVYADYQASSDGRIRSVDHLVRCSRGGGMRMCAGRERVTFPLRNGYLALVLSVDSAFVNVRVHRFVCETFHGLAPNPTSVVRHLNGTQTDNRPENLCWGTPSENQYDRVRHGTHHRANQTECIHGHAFTEENTLRRPDRPGMRECITCKKTKDAERHARNRRERQARTARHSRQGTAQ